MPNVHNRSFPIDRVMLPAGREGDPAIALAPCTADEAHALARTFAAMEPWLRYPYTADALAAYLGVSDIHAPRYAIFHGETLAGALGLRLDWLRGPFIQFLGFLPAFQNSGLGGQILEWTITGARAGEAQNVWVSASVFNSPALRFYERHGFARVAILDGLVRDGLDEVLLRRRL